MRWYRGHADGTAGAHVIEVLEGDELVGLLAHHAKHSPDGFSWGYAGSGPTDLARCLLIDHLGNEAWCSSCGGRGSNGCDECWGEQTSFKSSLYQAFKFDFVAKWPQTGSWSLTAAEIDQWIDSRVGDGGV